MREQRSWVSLGALRGEVSERLKEHAWKVCVRQKCTEGSNPSLSATSNRTANAGRNRLYARGGGKHLNQITFRANDADLAICHLDALGEGAKVVAPIAAALVLIRPHAVLANLWTIYGVIAC